jgi:hypothetical protein
MGWSHGIARKNEVSDVHPQRSLRLEFGRIGRARQAVAERVGLRTGAAHDDQAAFDAARQRPPERVGMRRRVGPAVRGASAERGSPPTALAAWRRAAGPAACCPAPAGSRSPRRSVRRLRGVDGCAQNSQAQCNHRAGYPPVLLDCMPPSVSALISAGAEMSAPFPSALPPRSTKPCPAPIHKSLTLRRFRT